MKGILDTSIVIATDAPPPAYSAGRPAPARLARGADNKIQLQDHTNRSLYGSRVLPGLAVASSTASSSRFLCGFASQ